jgi:hypothetical protein
MYGGVFAGWGYSQNIFVRGKANQAAADSAWGANWRSDCNANIIYSAGS